jgi:hypothetical protein
MSRKESKFPLSIKFFEAPPKEASAINPYLPIGSKFIAIS